eukprot:1147694-Pelagomonas_calceolata.AAC.11
MGGNDRRELRYKYVNGVPVALVFLIGHCLWDWKKQAPQANPAHFPRSFLEANVLAEMCHADQVGEAERLGIGEARSSTEFCVATEFNRVLCGNRVQQSSVWQQSSSASEYQCMSYCGSHVGGWVKVRQSIRLSRLLSSSCSQGAAPGL